MLSTDNEDITDYTFQSGPVPPCANFARLDELQQQHRPFLRTEEAGGYWVITDHDAIREGLQHPELFSNRVMVPTEPNPAYKWIPLMLDPPEHSVWRRLLSEYFSPGRVKTLEDEQRSFAVQLIEKFRTDGRCDFYRDFAAIFPTTIFLQIMGLPIDRLPHFMVWEDAILRANADSDPDGSKAGAAMGEVMGYFAGLIAERRANPDSRGDDIVTHALEWSIDGQPPADQDLLSCFLLLFMAGLDTVTSQLGYAMYHLATSPADRATLVADPDRVPDAVEEMVRAYSIVQTARIATQDIDFHGCPIKEGDMVAFPLAMANRDPKEHDRGGEVDFDAGAPRHIGFGAGPHRCLGSHLARQEMVVAIQEWHRLIPDYQLAGDGEVGPVVEHSGGVFGIDRLPLRWKS
jgi:cytochrome P450